MRNHYEIIGDDVHIFLKSNNKIAIISKSSFDVVNSFPGSWSCSTLGYVKGSTYQKDGKTKSISLHRLIMNPPAGLVVDHINHNPLDNRLENLRIVTHGQNSQNRGKARVTNRSGIRGVVLLKSKRWSAQIKLGEKKVHLGTFDNPDEAELTAIEARIKHFPYYNPPAERYAELKRKLGSGSDA